MTLISIGGRPILAAAGFRRLLFVFMAAAAWAQPAQPAPAQPSAMRDSRFQARPAAGGIAGRNHRTEPQPPSPARSRFSRRVWPRLPLSTYFSGHKPVLLALVYYTCPMLCNLVLTGMESSLRAISLDPGRDFEVVAVSFDPHDTPEIAAAKRANYSATLPPSQYRQRLAFPDRRRSVHPKR
jgi:protein SCO1